MIDLNNVGCEDKTGEMKRGAKDKGKIERDSWGD